MEPCKSEAVGESENHWHPRAPAEVVRVLFDKRHADMTAVSLPRPASQGSADYAFAGSAHNSDRTHFEPLADLCVRGEVRIYIDRVFTLEEVPAALARVGEGRALGKVVVTLQT